MRILGHTPVKSNESYRYGIYSVDCTRYLETSAGSDLQEDRYIRRVAES